MVEPSNFALIPLSLSKILLISFEISENYNPLIYTHSPSSDDMSETEANPHPFEFQLFADTGFCISDSNRLIFGGDQFVIAVEAMADCQFQYYEL